MNHNDKDAYFEFLTKNYNDCISEDYKQIYENKYREDYPKNNSDHQIKFLFDKIMSTENMLDYTNFLLLFNRFLNFNNTLYLIEKLKKKNYSDTYIISKIKKIYYFHQDTITHCNKINIFIKYIKKYINIPSFKINSTVYLDIGCGDGVKTLKIANALNINKEQINGTDIDHWGPYQEDKKLLPFKFKYILNDGKLDYENDSIDIITCILTLHHIENFDFIVSEIYRVLKPNGYFILVEHDNYTNVDQLILEIQHNLYSYIYDNYEDFISNPTFNNFLNNKEFEYILTQKFNFKLIVYDNVYMSVDLYRRYDKQFYQIYTK
jgi:ubiquinone/menaquinone biosynthesis C-methylase UbiE